MPFCNMRKQPVRSPCSYPQGFPQLSPVWMNIVDNLWTMWITFCTSAILQPFSPVDLWITLWKLWMNAPLAVHKHFLQL